MAYLLLLSSNNKTDKGVLDAEMPFCKTVTAMEARSMLSTTLKRTLQLVALTMVLSAFFSSETLAVSQLIEADEGGVINIAEGIALVIPPNALDKDTVIHARVAIKKKRRNRICYNFGPDGIAFNKPAKLVVSRQVLKDADVRDLGLYGEDGERIRPRILRKRKIAIYNIEHFSLYYHRRR